VDPPAIYLSVPYKGEEVQGFFLKKKKLEIG
jgi:hypothetical protein